MNRFQARAAHVPPVLNYVVGLSLAALGGYWWFTYTGLYRVLAEWQLKAFHSYYPKYTGFFTIILTIVPGAILLQIIGAVRAKERSPEEAAVRESADQEHRQRVSAWITGHLGRLMGLTATLTFLAIGAYYTGSGLAAGDRVSVDAGALERGEQPAGHYAELTGKLVTDRSISFSERSSSSNPKIYVPIVSPEWRAGRPFKVFLETYESYFDRYAEDLASGRFEGMLTQDSLPGPVKKRFYTSKGSYWVLEYRETPQSHVSLGRGLLVCAAIAGLLTAIGWMVARRRARTAS